MNIHHIRNATAILDYGGKKFLIDPMLAEKGTLPPFISKGPFPSPRKDQMNPLVDLPMPVEDIINGIDKRYCNTFTSRSLGRYSERGPT